jgi:Domain of unknown function (DUF4390)
MTTMGFSWLCWKKACIECAAGWRQAIAPRAKRFGRSVLAGVWLLLPLQGAAETALTEVTQLQIERQNDGIYLSASLQFELPPVVEEALFKGVSMYFVAEADVYRARWYWADKKLLTAERHMRLAYHPLTRRWRVNVSSGALSGTNLGLALNQSYETLPEAVGSLRRISRWRIAEAADMDIDQRHTIDFRFKLDLSQLPRPFQIGVLGQGDWNIAATSALQIPAGK